MLKSYEAIYENGQVNQIAVTQLLIDASSL
jgi:hypothetical protein